jgi:hypothetical protein
MRKNLSHIILLTSMLLTCCTNFGNLYATGPKDFFVKK